MEDQENKLADGLHALLTYKQDLLSVLVKEGMSVRIALVVISRQIVSQQKRDRWRPHCLFQEPRDEDAKSVDDELWRSYVVDIGRTQVTMTQPLGVLEVNIRSTVIASWKISHEVKIINPLNA